MPLYVYECPECEIELEERRPAWQADDPVECPICHGLCVRAISMVHIRRSPAPVYATPEQVARIVHGHGVDCACCRPRRRS